MKNPWRCPKLHFYMNNHLASFALFSTFLKILPPFCEIQGKLKDTTEMIHCWVLPWLCDTLQLLTWELLHVDIYITDVDPRQLKCD